MTKKLSTGYLCQTLRQERFSTTYINLSRSYGDADWVNAVFGDQQCHVLLYLPTFLSQIDLQCEHHGS